MFGILFSKSLHKDVSAMLKAFAEGCPPPAKAGSKAIPEKKVAELLDVFYRQVAAYARDKHLGVLGRARLAKALQEEMRKLEYPDALVARVINGVTLNALVAPGRR